MRRSGLSGALASPKLGARSGRRAGVRALAFAALAVLTLLAGSAAPALAAKGAPPPAPAPAAPSLLSVSVIPASVVGGPTQLLPFPVVIAGGITLSGPLPATPIVVSFSSSNPGVATVPASITFVGPNANTTFGFNVTVAAVTAPTPVTISASLGGVTKTALLTVLPTPPPVLTSLFVTTMHGFARVTAMATSDVTVGLSGSDPLAATVPATVTVRAGSTLGQFDITPLPVSAPTPVTITATLPTGSMSAVMTVVPRPPQNDCGTGADAGNTLATATPITLPVSCTGRLLGLPLGGSVLDVDVDAYKFTVPQPFQQFSGSVTMRPGTLGPAVLMVLSRIDLYDPADILRGSIDTFEPCPGFICELNPTEIFVNDPLLGLLNWVGEGFSATLDIVGDWKLVLRGRCDAVLGCNTEWLDETYALSANLGGPPPPPPPLPPPVPFIQAVFPSSGPVGTLVTISGYLGGASQVTFGSGGLPALFNVTGNAQVTATVPAGAATGGVTVTTPNGTATSGGFGAGGVLLPGSFTVTTAAPPPVASLSSVSVTPTSVVGGNSSQGTVTLTAGAPAGGAVVGLSNANTAVATVPASVTIAAGATSATFSITTTSVTATTALSISGTFGGVTRTAVLTVNPVPPPVSLSAITLNPATVTGGASATGTATLTSAAPSGGLLVSLASSNSGVATVPASVTVGAGATSATFAVTTSAVVSSTAVTITGSGGGAVRTATLTVNPQPAAALLTLTATGRTGETVSSSPVGLKVNVGTSGSASFTTGTVVTLSVSNGRDAIWSGGCSSGGVKTKTCSVTINAATSVTANVQ